jgi:hypothetical protein
VCFKRIYEIYGNFYIGLGLRYNYFGLLNPTRDENFDTNFGFNFGTNFEFWIVYLVEFWLLLDCLVLGSCLWDEFYTNIWAGRI